MFVKPPQDQRKDRYIKKLKKLLCGLDNAICQVWLKIKETLISMGLKIMPWDSAFYYFIEGRNLQEAVLTNMDKFTIIGNADFLTKIANGISETLTVSMIERDVFKLHKVSPQ